MLFHLAVAAVAAVAGGIASIAGFGIGSLLTPLVASQYGMKTAVERHRYSASDCSNALSERERDLIM